MWRESYRIGIEEIDSQHIELFKMVEDLLKAIDAHAGKDEFKKTIEFLKNYVVRHFADEEKYQISIHYRDLDAHIRLHREFTHSVLEFEKRLSASDYSIKEVKELAGMLIVWLIYHVSDADQKIAGNLAVAEKSEKQNCITNVALSVMDALEKMAGMNSDAMKQSTLPSHEIRGDILVSVDFFGNLNGTVYYSFSKEFAFNLIEIMMLSTPIEVDELVISAMAEIANIASGNAASAMASQGTAMDITTPDISLSAQILGALETIEIDTEVGGITVSVLLN